MRHGDRPDDIIEQLLAMKGTLATLFPEHNTRTLLQRLPDALRPQVPVPRTTSSVADCNITTEDPVQRSVHQRDLFLRKSTRRPDCTL